MKNFVQQVKDFYPEYLRAHRHPANKALHCIGNLLVVALAISVIVVAFLGGLTVGEAAFLFAWLPFHLVFSIYVFVWPAHLFIEKNKPATWAVSRWITKACDWKMLYDLFFGRLKWDTRIKMNVKFATEGTSSFLNKVGHIEYGNDNDNN